MTVNRNRYSGACLTLNAFGLDRRNPVIGMARRGLESRVRERDTERDTDRLRDAALDLDVERERERECERERELERKRERERGRDFDSSEADDTRDLDRLLLF